MSKRPFNKIRKIEKKENIEGNQEGNEEFKQQHNVPKEIEPGKVSILPSQKKRINIINPDALKNNQDNSAEVQPKISLGSKPNLFKGKREGGKLIIGNRESANTEVVEHGYGEAPKPTPMIIKKRPHLDLKNKDRENIIIQEDQFSLRNGEQSKELLSEQPHAFIRKPDLKIKRLGPKPQFSQRQDIQEQSAQYLVSNSVYPNDGHLAAPIQYREINIEPAVGISEGKIDKQRKRTYQLSNLLNLEIDLYEQTLSIGNITPYEIYINKIKGGFLKNSQDQAFDEKTANQCQTLSFQYADFTNQCPQDYSLDINKIQRMSPEHLFEHFILKVSPIIEELIKPTSSITEPPIFLLAFRPVFKSFVKCPYPIFIYHSQEFKLDLIVVGEKLYITQGEIESVLMIGKTIIAGLKNGYLILWNGQNSKTSRLYEQIKELTNTTNFQLPSYCTHSLQKYSPYASEFSIVSLLHEEKSEFISLDSNGKIVKWTIEDGLNDSQSLRAVSVTELRLLVQRPMLKAYSIKKRGDSHYINTSIGIIILQNNEIRQKLQNQGQTIIQFEVPKRSPLVFTITANNSLRIYNELYSHSLLSMDFLIGPDQLRQILIPELQHDNREIIILSAIYITDSAGHVYEVKILDNQYEYVQQLGEEGYDARKDKNVIFRGVNKVGETLETLRLMRDLKMTTGSMRLGVNTEKSVSNLKSIIEKNRELMTLLEHQTVMIL